MLLNQSSAGLGAEPVCDAASLLDEQSLMALIHQVCPADDRGDVIQNFQG